MARALSEFQLFVKPIGAICNLGCRHYYLRKQELYPKGAPLLKVKDCTTWPKRRGRGECCLK